MPERTRTAGTLSLRRDAAVSVQGPITISLDGRDVLRLPQRYGDLLRRVGEGGMTEAELVSGAAEPVAAALLIDRLHGVGLLDVTFALEAGVIRVVAVAPPPAFAGREWNRPLDPAGEVTIDPFAYQRWDAAGTPVLHAPFAPYEVRGMLDIVRDGVRLVPSRTGPAIVELLVRAGLAEQAPSAEGTDPRRHWEFADALAHATSREGWLSAPAGATFRFRPDKTDAPLDPPPAEARFASDSARRIVLSRDPLPDASFADVLRRRRSVRPREAVPPTLAELGRLLWHAARARRIPFDSSALLETSSRPYPSGGGAYSLEIFLVIAEAEGIRSGLYWYDAFAHELARLGGLDERARAALGDSAFAMGEGLPPQVLLVFASRFQRVQWKYERIAYSLILKEVGTLTQTLYLVATALGLSPCAIGGGDAATFSRLIEHSPLEVSSVGEFAIGGQRRSHA